ncbi:MAG TPA: AraC family transcriptional regulator [Thermoanaerobaculia bacterium]|nr:AraC family transcriptional regulator [Thermoanaerobaculia bacterium]
MVPVIEREERFREFSVRCVRYPAGLTQMPHAHPEPRLCLILRGTLAETSAAGAVNAGAWSLAVKPPGVEHSDSFGPTGTRILSVLFATERGATSAEARTSLGRWQWLDDGTGARPGVAALAALTVGGTAGRNAIAAAVRALLHELQERERRRAVATSPPWMALALAALERDNGGPGAVSRAAGAAGVHRVTLARRLRRHGKGSARGRLCWLRVRRAAHWLTGTTRPLARIAVEAGFADQSHMCRDVRRTLGVTPGRLRQLAAGPG